MGEEFKKPTPGTASNFRAEIRKVLGRDIGKAQTTKKLLEKEARKAEQAHQKDYESYSRLERQHAKLQERLKNAARDMRLQKKKVEKSQKEHEQIVARIRSAEKDVMVREAIMRDYQ